jgi:hypothetical protein
MPIRINLLAEAQALEEIRRRDPVKRAVWVAVCLVAMMLVWWSCLQVEVFADSGTLKNLEASLNSQTNQFSQIISHKKKLAEINSKLTALNQLAAERYLQANVLDALMHTSVDGIQITHLHTDQAYEVTPEVKAATSESGKPVPAKPATTVEKIRLLIDAKDTSPNPGGDQINKFKEALAHSDYFAEQHISTNNIFLKNFSTPQIDNESGKAYVLFSLECVYPERVR